MPRWSRSGCARRVLALLAVVSAAGCGGGGGAVDDPYVIPTATTVSAAGDGAGSPTPSGEPDPAADPAAEGDVGDPSVPEDVAPIARADVIRAGEAAAAAAGGEAIRSAVDLMGYVVLLRLPDGSFVDVQLDIGFGVVFVEPDEDGRRDADQLADDVDLARAVELALDRAAEEEIGAAGDGVVVGAELERDGYDIDLQYPDGRTLEVRLDDDQVVTGVRIRSG